MSNDSIKVIVNDSWKEESFVKQHDLAFEFKIPNTTKPNTITKIIQEKCDSRFNTKLLYPRETLTSKSKELTQFKRWEISISTITFTIVNRSLISISILKVNALPNPLCSIVGEYFVTHAPWYAIDCCISHNLPYISNKSSESNDKGAIEDYRSELNNQFRLSVIKPLLDRMGMSKHVEKFFSNSKNHNFESIIRSIADCKTSQKDILDSIDNDSIEWNDFDMIIFEFCDLWARMFDENIYPTCCGGVAAYLSIRSHIKKILGDDCDSDNDKNSDNDNDNDTPCTNKKNKIKSPYILGAEYECSIWKLDKICQHLQFIMNKNDGIYKCLPFDNVEKNVRHVERIKTQINHVNMTFRLVRKLHDVYGMFEFGIRIWRAHSDRIALGVMASWPKMYDMNPGFVTNLDENNYNHGYNYDNDYNCYFKCDTISEAVYSSWLLQVGNLDTLVRKYDEILGIMFSTQMQNAFGNSDQICTIQIDQLLEYFLEMFYVIIEKMVPLGLQVIRKIECILKVLMSQYLILKNMNEYNIHIFDLYYALLLKLRFKRLKFNKNDYTNRKNIMKLIDEITPYYDHFLGDNCKDRKNITGKYWYCIVDELIWVEFLVGKLSIESKLEYMNEADCVHCVDCVDCVVSKGKNSNKNRYHKHDHDDHDQLQLQPEIVKQMILNNPKYKKMVQLYSKQNFRLDLISKPRLLKFRFRVVFKHLSIFSRKYKHDINKQMQEWEDINLDYVFDLTESITTLSYRLGLINNIEPQYFENAKKKNYKNFYYLLKNIIKSAKSKKGKVKSCKECQCECKQLKRCKGCHRVWYCSKLCQKRHWIQHRSVCLKLRV